MMKWARLAERFDKIAEKCSDLRLVISILHQPLDEEAGEDLKQPQATVHFQIFADWMDSPKIKEFKRLAGEAGCLLYGGGERDPERWYRWLHRECREMEINAAAPAAVSGFPDLRTFDIRDVARVSAGVAGELASAPNESEAAATEQRERLRL